MVLGDVTLYVGVITVPEQDFSKALYGDVSDEELERIMDGEWLVPHLNEEFLQPNQSSDSTKPQLEANRVTHDVIKGEPIVIGLNLGRVCCNLRDGYDRTVKSMASLALETLSEAIKEFQELRDSLAKTQPVLYALIKDRPVQVIFVQNDCSCSCCS